ncbi:succinylglutamate desuccinylase/aspartoacylase family protein [Spongiimicrobium sp. 3-5]|uniref:succinylglutamate desuccinylase/aspartoacylase family protein n=1 Tax=Spongiimicrobium sp. 3-5 TaxID=3332596 RepID=UPI003981673C
MAHTIVNPKKKKEEHHLIGHFKGNINGPTIVFFGGIHGNEPSGVAALQKVFARLKKQPIPIHGNIFGISGNIRAQLQGTRFLDQDLNRLWTKTNIECIKRTPEKERTIEETALLEILEMIRGILDAGNPSSSFYFIDLHSTSSRTLPFITINDALINRKFSKQFSVPIILGIEEYLEGPLLSYINEMGYVSLGFEAGQHFSEETVHNGIAFIWLALVFSGVINSREVQNIKEYYRQLQKEVGGNTSFYEVVHRQIISAEDDFRMIPGFKSFDRITKGTLLATTKNENSIRAKKRTILFMPLYQNQGEEGFFLIRKIPVFALWLSSLLRKVRLHRTLTILPGISWTGHDAQGLLVNRRVAKFLTKPFFHLLGYRNRTLDQTHIIMTNREHKAKNELYRKAAWFKKRG